MLPRFIGGPALALLLVSAPTYADLDWGGAAAGAGEAMSEIGRMMIQDAMIRQREQDEYQRQMELQRQQESLRQQHEELARQRYYEAEVWKVNGAHPGWQETVAAEEFVSWMKKQPESVRRLADSNRAEDAILMLDLYKQHLKEKP